EHQPGAGALGKQRFLNVPRANTSWALALSCWVAVACSSTEHASRPPANPVAEPRVQLATGAPDLPPAWPTADAYVVAPGLRWLLLLRPDSLAEKLALAGSAFPDATRRRAFERSTGLRLTDVTDVAIAGFDY